MPGTGTEEEGGEEGLLLPNNPSSVEPTTPLGGGKGEGGCRSEEDDADETIEEIAGWERTARIIRPLFLLEEEMLPAAAAVVVVADR
mmetsp:Transcript_23540/g.37816  ORF Transcript_23540/g.37816 Transcript_23540/m.37816 type:complete len:87 (-) Transcript_23540:1100-1360(-)